MTSAPSFSRPLTTLVTIFSLPGMGLAEMMIKSPGPTRTCRWLADAMRDRALSGSPWLPVVMSTTWSGGYLLISSMSMSTPSGAWR